MRKNRFLTPALIGVLVVMIVPCGAFAQMVFSEQELDQMLAPIALYPDSLLAQVLVAATYPDQVAEADAWLRQNPGLKGNALNAALDGMNWDLSVKALAPFPQVLSMMASQPDWTQKLGQAFLAQQADVMDAVQKLRARAQASGNLRTTAEDKVIVRGAGDIEIVPVNPEVVYVPRYDPLAVYGPWWWPAYPPFVYAPVFPGIAIGPIGVAIGFWPVPFAVGPVWGFGWGSWGWGTGACFINVNRTVNINSTSINVNNFRSSMQTTGLHNAAVAGRIGSTQTRAAVSKTFAAHPGLKTSGSLTRTTPIGTSRAGAVGTAGKGPTVGPKTGATPSLGKTTTGTPSGTSRITPATKAGTKGLGPTKGPTTGPAPKTMSTPKAGAKGLGTSKSTSSFKATPKSSTPKPKFTPRTSAMPKAGGGGHGAPAGHGKKK